MIESMLEKTKKHLKPTQRRVVRVHDSNSLKQLRIANRVSLLQDECCKQRTDIMPGNVTSAPGEGITG